MFPLSDDSLHRITPIVTWSIIGACVLIFLWQSSLGAKAGELAIYQYGMIPARLFGVAKLRSQLVAIPAWATVLTSMFMHGGWLHLGLNMLFLWVFGGKVEESMGHSRFLVFYLLGGVAAAVAQAIMSPGSTLPMVGASGAISGVLGAYFLLHPLASIRVLFFLGFIPIVAHVPALIFLGLWFAAQIASATFFVLSEPGASGSPSALGHRRRADCRCGRNKVHRTAIQPQTPTADAVDPGEHPRRQVAASRGEWRALPVRPVSVRMVTIRSQRGRHAL